MACAPCGPHLQQASPGFFIQQWQGFKSKQEIAEECKAPGGPGLKLKDATFYGPKQDVRRAWSESGQGLEILTAKGMDTGSH